MRTKRLEASKPESPWLEYHATDGSAPQRTVLESLPFVIGRGDAADLHLDSSRVSRVHARIERDSRGFRVVDSTSTNGTLLNGTRVHDAPLVHGDILVIADIEFTFHCQPATDGLPQATQVMGQGLQDLSTAPGGDPGEQLIAEVRKLQESVTRRALRPYWHAVVQLQDEQLFGFEAITLVQHGGASSSHVGGGIAGIPCRVTSRARALLRLLAVEDMLQRGCDGRVVLNYASHEWQDQRPLTELQRLCARFGSDQLVVQMPVLTTGVIERFAELYSALKGLGVAIAYDQVAGGPSQLRLLRKIPPNFVRLSANFMQAGERQPSNLQALISGARDLGAEVIVPGVDSEPQRVHYTNLGCRFGQGMAFDREFTPDLVPVSL